VVVLIVLGHLGNKAIERVTGGGGGGNGPGAADAERGSGEPNN